MLTCDEKQNMKIQTYKIIRKILEMGSETSAKNNI